MALWLLILRENSSNKSAAANTGWHRALWLQSERLVAAVAVNQSIREGTGAIHRPVDGLSFGSALEFARPAWEYIWRER
jgi:hypothetical protein